MPCLNCGFYYHTRCPETWIMTRRTVPLERRPGVKMGIHVWFCQRCLGSESGL